MLAVAYVNHGRWIADCPRPHCNSARRLEPRQARFHCAGEGGCGMDCPVGWPPNPDELWEVLERRPVPMTRNWFPAGHGLAVRAGVEHGQTVADLVAENHEHGVH
jgi:hypothetical protein